MNTLLGNTNRSAQEIKMEEDLQKTDEDLIKEYLSSNNPSSLNVLFSRYLDVGFRTAMRYMRNQSDAEDVLQLAFIQFLNNLHHFREGATTVKPWLMKMIVNTSIKKLQEENSRKHRQDKIASQRLDDHSKKEDEVVESNKKEELKIKIKNLVDTLPEKYRSPIWLVLYEGFTYPEVASVLELPEKTVRTQVSRGLERLKEILGSMGSILSVDAITALMLNNKLELAPATAKAIINSPDLYKSIATKSAQAKNQSARVVAFSKSTFLSLKFILPLIGVCLVALTGMYALKNLKEKKLATYINRHDAMPAKPDNIKSKETNESWIFSNEKDRDLPLKLGNWDWSEKTKGMAAPINQIVMISLPITTQEKPFVIECTSIPNITRETPQINLYFSAFWVKNNLLLGHEGFKSKDKYLLNQGQQVVQKMYFYNNHIYEFMGEKCIRYNRYTQDISGATVSIISKNFIFFKITSRTLEEIPRELQDTNINNFKLTSEFAKDWIIDEKNISLKN